MPPASLPSDFKPLNREPPACTLLSSSITSTTVAFDRNHGPIPQLSASTHVITISDTTSSNSKRPPLLNIPATLPFSTLRTIFQPTTLTAALQCAGNRRHTMRTKLKEVDGIDWRTGAVMNCTWTGARLIDVLSHILGRDASRLTPAELAGRHLAFACHAVPVQDDSWYGSSIPLARAVDPAADILLVYEQNGAPLSPAHGFPVRVLIPGVTGARCVKWLDAITIQDHESQNFYMQRDYKILPPQVADKKTAKSWWPSLEPLMDMPVNSVIFARGADSADSGKGENEYGEGKVQRDANGMVEVHGYSLPGGSGGPVTKVEIRIDSGDWITAQLLPPDYNEANNKQQDLESGISVGRSSGDGGGGGGGGVSGGERNRDRDRKWSWTLWRWKGRITAGRHTIWSRAMDRSGQRQEREYSEWNLRGVAYNGFGEVVIDVI